MKEIILDNKEMIRTLIREDDGGKIYHYFDGECEHFIKEQQIKELIKSGRLTPKDK